LRFLIKIINIINIFKNFYKMAKHTSIEVIKKLTVGEGIFSNLAYDENKSAIDLYTIADSVDIQQYFQPGLIFDENGYWKSDSCITAAKRHHAGRNGSALGYHCPGCQQMGAGRCYDGH
jgi:hypothetical protein